LLTRDLQGVGVHKWAYALEVPHPREDCLGAKITNSYYLKFLRLTSCRCLLDLCGSPLYSNAWGAMSLRDDERLKQKTV